MLYENETKLVFELPKEQKQAYEFLENIEKQDGWVLSVITTTVMVFTNEDKKFINLG